MAHFALRCFRFRRPDLNVVLRITRHTTLAGCIAILAGAGEGFATDTLVLSNEQLDMTAAEIEAGQVVAAAEAPNAPSLPSQNSANPAPATYNAWLSEFVSNENPLPAGCADSPQATPGGSIGSFDQCIEVSIRGGAGYKAASGVCQALFPGQG